MVLGFAFYLQPTMMPLLHGMPPSLTGLATTATAIKNVILGTPSCVRTFVQPTEMHIREYDMYIVMALLIADISRINLQCPLPHDEQACFTANLLVFNGQPSLREVLSIYHTHMPLAKRLSRWGIVSDR